jgi:hypothetical protein
MPAAVPFLATSQRKKARHSYSGSEACAAWVMIGPTDT